MYRKLLSIHLCAAMFSLPFLVMYSVSAVQMAHMHGMFMRPSVTDQNFSLPPGIGDARAVVRQLPVRGELVEVHTSPAALNLRIVRPGTVYEVKYAAASGQASLRTTTSTFLGMLNRLHHVNGLWHDFAPINVWSVTLALVSVGLFTLGATGIYLWFRNKKERLVGAVLLAGGMALTLSLIISMRA